MNYKAKIGLLLLLSFILNIAAGCRFLEKKQKIINPPEIEWGKQGRVPNLPNDYNWICCNSDRFMCGEK